MLRRFNAPMLLALIGALGGRLRSHHRDAVPSSEPPWTCPLRLQDAAGQGQPSDSDQSRLSSQFQIGIRQAPAGQTQARQPSPAAPGQIPPDIPGYPPFEPFETPEPVPTVGPSQTPQPKPPAVILGGGTGLPDATSTSLKRVVELPTTEVVKTIAPSVVNITTEVGGGVTAGALTPSGVGTGVIIDTRGHILTIDHVLEGARSTTVTLHNGVDYPAEIVGRDPATDLAVIKIDAGGLVLPPRSAIRRIFWLERTLSPSATLLDSRGRRPSAREWSAPSVAPSTQNGTSQCPT